MINYQWYPGHMTKAKRQMQEDIKLIDLIIELLDARVPYASRNPDIDELGRGKGRLILLNKADLADSEATKAWENYFTAQGCQVVRINSRTGSGIRQIQGKVLEACKEKLERDKKRGIKNRPIRAMVVGIPNVGKSTFINSYAGKAVAKTGNKPGVTKGKQWIRMSKQLELLDTPGILWPKFEDQLVGLHLAMIGSINDEILNVEELALDVIRTMCKLYPGRISERYSADESSEVLVILEQIALNRGCLKKGAEPDLVKAARMLVEDFRSGKLGPVTVERPEVIKEGETGNNG